MPHKGVWQACEFRVYDLVMLDRVATADERDGMTWWNALSEDERRQKLAYLIDLKRQPTVAKAWEVEKRDRAHRLDTSK